MSEQMQERLREHNRMILRIEELDEYLDGTGRYEFSRYDVQKMIKHIRQGGGWL